MLKKWRVAAAVLAAVVGCAIIVASVATSIPHYVAAASQIEKPDYAKQRFNYEGPEGVKAVVSYGDKDASSYTTVTVRGQDYRLEGIRPQFSKSGKFILLDEGVTFWVYRLDTRRPQYVSEIGRSWDHKWFKRTNGDELSYHPIPSQNDLPITKLFQ